MVINSEVQRNFNKMYVNNDCLFYTFVYRVARKSKPLPNYQKIILNRIKTCQWWDYIYSSYYSINQRL